jgi:hypothetical protein
MLHLCGHPSKDEPPLAVDADRVKSLQFTAQFLEVVARRHAQVEISRRVVEHL